MRWDFTFLAHLIAVATMELKPVRGEWTCLTAPTLYNAFWSASDALLSLRDDGNQAQLKLLCLFP